MRAVVTGGTRGIGLSIAKRLLDDNYRVITTGTKSEPDIKNDTEYHQVDFNDLKALKKFIQFLKTSEIDILINNAGVNKIGNFESIEIQEFNEIINVNLTVPFQLSQAVIPYMKERKWGRIVNIASIWSNKSKEYRASYSASKFGLDGMTVAMSAELSQYGILANCLSPGFTETDLTRKILGEDGIKEIQKQIPMKRLGQPNEIAEIVNWLVSESNSYLTGQNIIIDGGFTRGG